MKNALLLLLSGILGTFSQEKKPGLDSVSAFIMKVESEMNSYKKTEFGSAKDRSCIYTKDKEAVLMTVFTEGRGDKKDVSWYFANNKLVYTRTTWTNTRSGKIEKDEELYLDNGRLVLWEDRDKEVDPNSELFKKLDSTLNATALQMRDAMVAKAN
jgi:hypothetical protein